VTRANDPVRPSIPPVAAGEERPLWSVMIPTYNCARYLRATLASVLAQDPGPERMQIEVVDDCSSDHPEAVVRELAPGRVSFFRQPRNVGHTHTFNTCLERARGQLVHLLHGDDAVRDGFYRTLERPFAEHPQIGAAFCRHVYVDERGRATATARLHQPSSGILPDAAFRIAAGLGVQPPAVVVRRSAYERLGGFDSRLRVAGEDLEMWVRIAASYPVWYEVAPLAEYHRRPGSLISSSARSGGAIRDYRTAIDLLLEHLDPSRRAEARAASRRRCAEWALAQARELACLGERSATLVQAREALRSDRSPTVAVGAAKAVARAILPRSPRPKR
jgi:glycosyltransferase involved in cell wall biosynthesis